MAKKKEAAPAAAEKKVRAPKEKKDSYLKNNFVLINDFDGVKTEGMHMRGVGVLVRETSDAGVCSTFIPGVKIKTKKDWKYLIIDKGPKSKKGAAASDEDEDEDED